MYNTLDVGNGWHLGNRDCLDKTDGGDEECATQLTPEMPDHKKDKIGWCVATLASLYPYYVRIETAALYSTGLCMEFAWKLNAH